MNIIIKYCISCAVISFVFLNGINHSFSKTGKGELIADLSLWSQEELPPLLQALPDGVSAAIEPYNEQETWIIINNTSEEIVSIPIFEVPMNFVNHCQLEYSAYFKTVDVNNKAYLEMLCFINDTPYFSRGIRNSFSGSVGPRLISIPFHLEDDSSEKLHLGVRMEGPGTVWIRGIKVSKYGQSLFAPSAYIRHGWLGAFLGIMGGIYGTAAGICVPKGIGKTFVRVLGIFLILFSAVCLSLGVITMMYDEHYVIWYSLVHAGLLGLIIFIPIHIMTLRNYQKQELQRMKAMDSMDSLS